MDDLDYRLNGPQKSSDLAKISVRIPRKLKKQIAIVAGMEDKSQNELMIELIQDRCDTYDLGISFEYIFGSMKPKSAWKIAVLRFMVTGEKYTEAYIRFWGSVISVPSEQVFHIYMRELETHKILSRVLPQPSYAPKQWKYIGPKQPELGLLEEEFWRPYFDQFNEKKDAIRAEQKKGGSGFVFAEHQKVTRGLGRSAGGDIP